MNKIKLPWSKRSMAFFHSLCIIILGIGITSWAMFGIWSQFDYSNMSFPAAYPVEGDYFGNLTIPALDKKLPIFQGTGVNELEKGMGHFSESALPGEKNNCVISGHRETALRGIGTLNKGDQLIVETSDGKFTYEVNNTRIVHKDDKTVIVPTDYALLTVTTCYPFNFLGAAPDRYIVSAVLVKSEAITDNP